MANVQEIGPYSAYAIAVKYGYQGTEEEWVQEQEANRKAAEAAAAAAAQSAKDAAASASGAAQSGQQAVQSIKDAQTAAEQALDTAKQQVVQAVKDEGAAQTAALNDAAKAHKNELESIASHPPQPNTETGKWQVWNAETGAYQDTDALYQGGYYTPAVSDDGVLTWQGSLPEMPAISSVNIKGPKGDKGDPGLGVPTPTTSDAGKVPTVKADGSAYELAGPYAPLSAAIRPTASGNPVSITDSVEWPLQGLKVYGKSTQDGTPSPENPVPIVSAGDGGSIGLTVSNGANLSQSMTISTPIGLPGIPVDSGGNYTDAEGQQWVCDEIDFARKTKTINNNIFSSLGHTAEFRESGGFWNLYIDDAAEYLPNVESGGSIPVGFVNIDDNNKFRINGVRGFIYISKTNGESLFGSLEAANIWLQSHSIEIQYKTNPVVTPLSDEEIAAYRTLHTYDGATVVSTAEDVAGLEVKYLADGEKYVERIVSQKAPEAAAAHTMALLADGIREGVNGV